MSLLRIAGLSGGYGDVDIISGIDMVVAEREIVTTVRSAYRTVHPAPARRGARDGSSPVRGSSPLAADGWFNRDPARPSTESSRVWGL